MPELRQNTFRPPTRIVQRPSDDGLPISEMPNLDSVFERETLPLAAYALVNAPPSTKEMPVLPVNVVTNIKIARTMDMILFLMSFTLFPPLLIVS